MPKSTFLPTSDHELLAWLDHFIANLKPEYGVSEAAFAELKAAIEDYRAKTNFSDDAAAVSKQATADKRASHHLVDKLVRAETRRLKARSDYSEGMGAHLGIEGPEYANDLTTSMPILNGVDQTGGIVALSFTKKKSEGINIYCQRENDADWVLLSRATVSPYLDNRPLLQTGKPELRRYSAVYIMKDKEISQYSNDLVVNCAP